MPQTNAERQRNWRRRHRKPTISERLDRLTTLVEQLTILCTALCTTLLETQQKPPPRNERYGRYARYRNDVTQPNGNNHLAAVTLRGQVLDVPSQPREEQQSFRYGNVRNDALTPADTTDSQPQPTKNNREKQNARRSAVDWRPSDTHLELAARHGFNPEWVADQADRYRDWHTNAKHKHTDHDAGFRNWIKSNAERAKPTQPREPRRTALDALYEGFRRAALRLPLSDD